MKRFKCADQRMIHVSVKSSVYLFIKQLSPHQCFFSHKPWGLFNKKKKYIKFTLIMNCDEDASGQTLTMTVWQKSEFIFLFFLIWCQMAGHLHYYYRRKQSICCSSFTRSIHCMLFLSLIFRTTNGLLFFYSLLSQIIITMLNLFVFESLGT